MLVMSLGNQYIQHFKRLRKSCSGYFWFRQLLSFIFLKENYLSLEFRDTGLRSFVNSAYRENNLLRAEAVSLFLRVGPS